MKKKEKMRKILAPAPGRVTVNFVVPLYGKQMLTVEVELKNYKNPFCPFSNANLVRRGLQSSYPASAAHFAIERVC